MEILYEGSLEKCFHPQDLRKDWRKRYFVLKRALGGGIMALEYYKDKDWKRLEPKGVLTLYSEFTVRKLNDLKKRFAFEVATVDNHFLLSALTDEARTQWCEMLETNMSVKSFEVTLEDCHSLNTLACPSGSLGFLQISESELVLKSNGSQLVVWPFSCIRRYKCRDCIFVVEVGRKAPSGEGIFCFRTPKHQKVFETLDKAVKERMKSKDANNSVDFAELIPSNQAPSSAINTSKGNKGDAQTTRFEQQQPLQDEYNHLDFSVGSRGLHSSSKMTSPEGNDLYNHLASSTPHLQRENHRVSDFGLPESSDLRAGQKLSKSMSSLTSITSGDCSESDYANLDSDVLGRESHVTQLKKAIERHASSQDYIAPGLSPTCPSPSGQHYDRLRGGLVSSPPDGNRNAWPNSHPSPKGSFSVENEYDSLNTGRDHRAFSPASEVNSPTEGLYNHLQEGSTRVASPCLSPSRTQVGPPKPSFKEVFEAGTVALKRCPGPQEEEENVYCVPREPTIAHPSIAGPISGLASSPSLNLGPRVAPKPVPRPKPTLPLPLAVITNVSSNTRKSPSNSRVIEVNSPEKLASSAGSPPTSNGVGSEDLSRLKSPAGLKASTKPALCPGGGIGQAIAQAGLVAQLKKNLVLGGGFNLTEESESGQRTPEDPALTITSQKISQGIIGKSQPVYAVSPFGKEEVEASENEYINIENAGKGLSMTQYDKVGSIVEGDYYEAMNVRSGYDEVGSTVSGSHGEVIYDVPRGEGIY